MKDKEHVHWFFNNKQEIFEYDARLSSDLTKSQRECYNLLNVERKQRIANGEADLIIKIINGSPTIVKKKIIENKSLTKN